MGTADSDQRLLEMEDREKEYLYNTNVGTTVGND